MSVVSIYDGEDNEVPELTDAEVELRFKDANAAGTPLAVAAINDVRVWLDDMASATSYRTNQAALSTNGGSVTEGDAGEAVYTLRLGGAEHAAVPAGGERQMRRLRVLVNYTRPGGGAGSLTKEIRYIVRKVF